MTSFLRVNLSSTRTNPPAFTSLYHKTYGGGNSHGRIDEQLGRQLRSNIGSKAQTACLRSPTNGWLVFPGAPKGNEFIYVWKGGSAASSIVTILTYIDIWSCNVSKILFLRLWSSYVDDIKGPLYSSLQQPIK